MPPYRWCRPNQEDLPSYPFSLLCVSYFIRTLLFVRRCTSVMLLTCIMCCILRLHALFVLNRCVWWDMGCFSIPMAVVLCFLIDSITIDYCIMSWNVRGLNAPAWQHEVKQVVQLHKPHILFLQETKLHHIDNSLDRSALGVDYEDNFIYLPSEGTSGGILIAYRRDHFLLQNPRLTTNTISATVIDSRTSSQWTITGVYGPQTEMDKKICIRELRQLKSTALPAWLLLGDFNLIYKEADKNNDQLNRRLMLRFRWALNHLAVKEINLAGRKFTWSNGQAQPTLTRIDRIFSTMAWEEIYVDPMIHVHSSSISDHTPLQLLPQAPAPKFTRFRFESFWTQMTGYQECVSQQWNRPIGQAHNSLLNLHIKLNRTAAGLRRWSKSIIPQGKLAMAICREVIGQLDKA